MLKLRMVRFLLSLSDTAPKYSATGSSLKLEAECF